MRIDAADGADAPVAIASAAYAALDREPSGVDYSALLDESAHAGGDPLRAAKAASDRHDEIVRKLEAERIKRDEGEARGARLADALLYETPGSRVDVFARARRGAIDSRLRRFDLAGSDAGVSYRDLVRDMTSMGAGGRAGVALRSVWAYRGQRRLLSWAIVAFVLGFVINMLQRGTTVTAIRGLAPQLESVADWISIHGDWFGRFAAALWILGALLLALNLFRAVSFSSLVLRGTQLLNHDLRERRRDLETRLGAAQPARRCAVRRRRRRRESAPRRRLGAPAARRRPARRAPTSSTQTRARQRPRGHFSQRSASASAGAPDAPDRLVFVIDNLDALHGRTPRSAGSTRRTASSEPARSESWPSIRPGSSTRSAARVRPAVALTNGCRSSSTCRAASASTASGSLRGCCPATDRRRRRRSTQRSRRRSSSPYRAQKRRS